MKKKLRIAFIVASLLGWVLLFAGLRGGSWVAFTIGIPVAVGFGIAAFALKSPAPA